MCVCVCVCVCVYAFANFLKRLLASVRLFFRPLGTTRLPLEGCTLYLVFELFSNICREGPGSIKM